MCVRVNWLTQTNFARLNMSQIMDISHRWEYEICNKWRTDFSSVDKEICFDCYVLTLFSSSTFLLQSPTSLKSEEYRQLFRLPPDEVSDLRVLWYLFEVKILAKKKKQKNFQCLVVDILFMMFDVKILMWGCILETLFGNFVIFPLL